MIDYIGNSWSIGADDAYKKGERPISRWDKNTILDEVAKIDEEKAILLKKVSLPILKEHLLKYTESHYTSREYNKTKFYALNVKYIMDLTDKDIEFLSTKKLKYQEKSKGLSITLSGIV